MTIQHNKLIIDKVAFERNYQYLFNNISSVLTSHECLQICGSNGSGKSTLLRILAGLIQPDNGTILWREKSIQQQKIFYTQQLFYIGHQNAFKPYLTVYENICLSCALVNVRKNPSEIHTLLEQTQLTHLKEIQVQQLSAGQKRRLSLVRLLLKHYPLWILDEPMTALDHEAHIWLIDLIKQHLTFGGIAIVATHQKLTTIENMKIITLGKSHA